MQQNIDWIIIGNYKYNQRYCLGQGSFGKVFKGFRLTDNLPVAIKQIDINQVQQKIIQNEINLLSKLQHNNVVKYFEAIKNQNTFYIITQYCNNGDLSELTANQSESQQLQETIALDIFFQIAQGFQYLKGFNIIHRDLKPANILINNKQYKISDFGLAKFDSLNKSIMAKTFVGSPIYMSPQILSKNFYTYKCDIWSLGIIFYQLLYGQLPWKASETNMLLCKILQNPQPYLKKSRKLCEVSRNILEGTINYLQKQRLSWSDLLNLKKKRKRIFISNSQKSISFTKTKVEKIEQRLLEKEYDPIDFSSIKNDLLNHEKQILKHIYNQIFSLDTELCKLTSKKFAETLVRNCKQYITYGSNSKQKFYDTCKLFIKMSSQNASLYMIDKSRIQEVRQIFQLVELIHDLITMKSNSFEQYQKVFNVKIENVNAYIGNVLSKINSFNSTE